MLTVIPGTCLAASAVLQWDPSTDPDLAGYRVYYQADSEALPFRGRGAVEGDAPIDGGLATGATVSGLDPNRSYYFAVTAYNSTGQESVYSNVIRLDEQVPPAVRITSPTSDSSVQGTVSIGATATDNVAVVKVQFFVNGALAAEKTAEPFAFSWETSSLAAGSYGVTAKAFDAAGNEGDSDVVSLSVAGDTEAPIVSVATPAAGSPVKGVVGISAAAGDNVGVARMELYLDGNLVSAGNTTPINYSWDSTAFEDGNHNLTAKAYDPAGNSGTASATVVAGNASPGTVPDTPAAGPVTISDAREALDIASGRQTPTSEQLQRLDVAPYLNGQSEPNGRVDTGDVVVILSKLVGKL